MNNNRIQVAASCILGLPYKKPVVYLHGGASNKTSGRCFEMLSVYGHDVWLCDSPGHGHSGHYTQKDCSIEQLAIMNFEFFKALGIRSPILAGHSLGGMISLQYALLYPNDVSGLILLGTYDASPNQGNKKISTEQLISLVQKAKKKYVPGVVHDLSQLNPMSEENIIDAGLVSTHPESLEKLINAVLKFDVRKQIQETANFPPTLILAGEEDGVMTPPMAAELQARIKGSQLEITDGAHNFLVQNPDGVKAALRKYYKYLFE